MKLSAVAKSFLFRRRHLFLRHVVLPVYFFLIYAVSCWLDIILLTRLVLVAGYPATGLSLALLPRSSNQPVSKWTRESSAISILGIGKILEPT